MTAKSTCICISLHTASPTCPIHGAGTQPLAGPQRAAVRADAAYHHPQHYGGDTTYEAIKVILAWGLGFCLGNAVKYICRAGRKDPLKRLEDLRKARWYIDYEIKQLETSGEHTTN
jgi:hypothetical protein